MANEQRLIDANKIKYKEYRSGGGRDYPENIVTEYEIAKMPTVDAVEVVRCKDCKWRNTRGCPYMNFNSSARDDLDFCSDGERKENG